MNKWKIFAFLSIITLMTLFIGGNLCASHPKSLQETNSTEKQATSCLHSQSEDTASTTASLLVSNGKAHMPHKFLCVQAQKEFDGKFFLTACASRENLTHTPPLYLCTSYQKHSKHPYTQLNHTYYLYTLKKILI